MGLFGKWSRRDLLKSSGAVAGVIAPVAAAAAPLALPANSGTEQDNLFTRIGVRPLINGRVAARPGTVLGQILAGAPEDPRKDIFEKAKA